MKHRLQATFIFCCLFPCFSVAATLTNVNVEHLGNNYIVHVESLIDANVNEVKRIVTDYENLPSINPYLKKSNITSSSKDGRKTVEMITEACILFICYKIKHVQVFQLIGTDIVYGHIISDKSDFKDGWTRWTISENKEQGKSKPITQVILDGEMTPNFFILPVIGPYHLKKKILEIATTTINNLEKIAQRNQ